MGREFVEIFDEWVETYDDSVSGKDEEYQAVFAGYDAILDEVASLAKGRTIEFGTGTGNLTEKLLIKGLDVLGIEPNGAMRARTQERFPKLDLADGDFMEFPLDGKPVDTFVSTYAFHHLTDDEKAKAAALYGSLLQQGGQVVFADTIFKNEEAKLARWKKVEEQGYHNLLEDLKREYYTTVPVMEKLFIDAGFTVTFKQLNEYAWLIHAIKA
ncbi:trans-aconitate 2-methyltransferase [Jeotgalibacillus sp. R-1-5s-1]|uniref:class I SAM-dependent methyltransferase n=1 Tax=Jeotgalibacillus sp. R-1-5s-1 TaxID=2555897 RepID=UPI00106B4FA0|nr:class I SAM-dependent methyltransferase [Jeotgalibacillus sp. R-1-5s-1]TFD92915.1 class I SAM-dependent methyltransferase [Jeotgalibacillus sp. R-1-5s-1]